MVIFVFVIKIPLSFGLHNDWLRSVSVLRNHRVTNHERFTKDGDLLKILHNNATRRDAFTSVRRFVPSVEQYLGSNFGIFEASEE